MSPNSSWRWRSRWAACLGAGLLALAVPPAAQVVVPAKLFNDAAASQLLNQIRDGLVEHNSQKMLGAFDLARMKQGPAFKQQVIAFLGQTDSIRVHFNILETAVVEAKGTALVEIEMEADPRDDNLPPVHKKAQLRLTAENSAGSWKFTELEPLSFFSTQP